MATKPLIRFNPAVENEDGTKGRWEHPPWVRIYRSFDYGWYPDPSVFLWFIVFGKRVICFKEMVRYRTPAQDLAKEVVAESRGMHITMTYADPTISVKSGVGASADIQSIQDVMERNGVPIELAVNDRVLYAHAINTFLKEEVGPDTPKFQMYAPGCPYLSKYLGKMRYDEKNPLAMADHKHDHAPCCLAYFAMNYLPNTAPPPMATNTGRWMRPKKSGRQVLGRDNVR